jgi:hypothetical protein
VTTKKVLVRRCTRNQRTDFTRACQENVLHAIINQCSRTGESMDEIMKIFQASNTLANELPRVISNCRRLYMASSTTFHALEVDPAFGSRYRHLAAPSAFLSAGKKGRVATVRPWVPVLAVP